VVLAQAPTQMVAQTQVLVLAPAAPAVLAKAVLVLEADVTDQP